MKPPRRIKFPQLAARLRRGRAVRTEAFDRAYQQWVAWLQRDRDRHLVVRRMVRP